MTYWTHTYAWGNNPVRAALKGRRCRVLSSGSRMTVLLEVEAHGQVLTNLPEGPPPDPLADGRRPLYTWRK